VPAFQTSKVQHTVCWERSCS